MRLFRLRRLARIIAALLLLAPVVAGPHVDDGDRACAPIVVDEHDESKHRFAPSVPIDHEHCAICHWTRLPRSPFAPIAALRSQLAAGLTIDERDPFTHRAPALDKLPARAPPTVL
jgi:hypothetical protein